MIYLKILLFGKKPEKWISHILESGGIKKLITINNIKYI